MNRTLKPLVFLLCLLPALYYFYAVFLAFSGRANLLGPDPAQALALASGTWAIRFLILALALTPLRHLLRLPSIWQYRRMLGLYALFYALLHFLVFLMFLLEWQWQDLAQEIVRRPYISFGFGALLLLVPLGLTSFNAAQRWLGRNWKRLHRLVYVAGLLAVLHIVWVIRSSYFDALLYGGLIVVLLAYRLLRQFSPAVRRFAFR